MAIPAYILTPLADVLAELYPDQASIRAISLGAGLTPGQIPLDLKAGNTWILLLNEAEAQDRTPALLDRARQQYPVEKRLATASQAYADWVAAGRPAQPTKPPSTEPSPPTRRIPAWVWVAVGAVAVVLVILGIMNGPLRTRVAATATVAPPVWQPPTSPIAFDWVEIPGGEFTMGSDPKQDSVGADAEQPQHTEDVGTFWMARTAVTVAQFAAFVEAMGYQTTAEKQGSSKIRTSKEWEEVEGANWRAPRGPGSSVDDKQDHPVTHISWDDAQAFSRWAGVRLPTEAEWEKACRGVEDSRIYPWGNEPPDADHANYGMNVGDTTAVGSYPAGKSPYDLVDLAGNVWEWTQTKWRSNYSTPADNDPQGDTARVVRGGSFDDLAKYVRCAHREDAPPLSRGADYGFRVVVSPFHP